MKQAHGSAGGGAANRDESGATVAGPAEAAAVPAGSGAPIAVVTGGARGIGLGVSTALAQAGYALVLCGRTPEPAAASLRDLRAIAPAVDYVCADVAAPDGRAALLDRIDRLGRAPDVLVNNAGVAPLERRDILDATEESFDRVMSINLRGPYFLTQQIARRMVARGGTAARSAAGTAADAGDTSAVPPTPGHPAAYDGPRRCIIFVTSVSAAVASVNRGEYCMSKAGLSMAAQLWAVRLAPFDIPVYEIRPGIVESDMTSGVRDKYQKLIDGELLLQKRWGTPGDVGRAVRALVEGALPYSTGQVVMVDGGLTVGRL